jgi:hypothetical protein
MTDAEWIADKEFKRDAAERERTAATSSKRERSLRAKRDRYQAMLTIGREGMRLIAAKAAASRS